MSHFSADEWVDFTRGLLPPAHGTMIQAALDQGCSECRSSLGLCSTAYFLDGTGAYFSHFANDGAGRRCCVIECRPSSAENEGQSVGRILSGLRPRAKPAALYQHSWGTCDRDCSSRSGEQ